MRQRIVVPARWWRSHRVDAGAPSMRGGISVCALVCALALVFPASSLADHLFVESFGPDGTAGSSFSGIEGSRSIAIDQTSGTIYVANQETESVYRFNENHQPANFSALGSPVLTGLPTRSVPGRSQLAVDQSSHRLYATSINSLFAFEASGAPAELSALAANEIGGFSGLCGVAVDSSGNIYAADRAELKVKVFAPTGAPLTEFEVGEIPAVEGSGPCNLAIDSAGDVYVNHSESAVEKFAPSSFPVTAATTYSPLGIVDPGQDYSLSVNPITDHLYVLRAVGPFGGGSGETEGIEYDPAGNEVPAPFGDAEPGQLRLAAGIAVRGSGVSEKLYVSSLIGEGRVGIFGPFVKLPQVETLAATEVAKTTTTMNASLNARGTQTTACTFEYGLSASYGQSAPCDSVDGSPISSPAEIPVDSASHSVAAHLTGLAENTEYHFRIVAGNSFGLNRGADATFETLGQPVIEEENVSGITATRARIIGAIDPRGEATTFVVQFVTGPQFDAGEWSEAITVPQPPKAVGAGVGPVQVSQELVGLIPGTVYHFRLVATNLADPPVEGDGQTFATFPATETELPNGRGYELVSPPAKAGEVFPPETLGLLDGTCVFACLPGFDLRKMPMQPSPNGSTIAYEGQAFGPGTASEANEYLAVRAADGWATEGISKPNYLASSTFAEQGSGYLGFSSDLSRGVIFQVRPSLSPAAPQEYANLYLWQRGGSVTPLLTEAPPHRPGGLEPASSFIVIYGGANAGAGSTPAFSHVVFEANDALTAEVPLVAPPAPEVAANERDLYEWVDGQLRLVNVLPNNATAAPDAVIGSGRLLSPNPVNEGPDFSHAISDDGSRIFWTDKATGQVYVRKDGISTAAIPDSGGFVTAAADGSRVLMSTGHLYDTTTVIPTEMADLTANLGGFQGALGASEDFARIYFVDTEVLAGANGENKSPTSGESNLYLWEQGSPMSQTTFVATLSSNDNSMGQLGLFGDWRPSATLRTAQVTPDGRYLAFMSVEPLTGYNNNQKDGKVCLGKGSTTGLTACTEVFEFDAREATLGCASCNPSTERPRGYANLSVLFDGGRDAILPPPHNLTANGRLFFESQDTLLTQDTNGQIQDVYQWEPVGPACNQPAGCLALISSGHSPNDSQFVNATPSGDDAFITTRERLVRRDRDDLLDLYDARVGGGFDEGEAISCTEETCRGALPPPPIQQDPASATFVGPGNPPKRGCRSGYVKKHGKCVKKHKKKTKRHAPTARGGAK